MIQLRLQKKLQERAQTKSLRSLQLSEGLIDFCSNDYLGFSRILTLKKTQTQGATGSRLISGNSKLFEKLESKIANFHKAKSGLIFNSGYDANLGLFSCIAEKGDTIIYDQYIHASIRDGIRLSNARSFAFAHNDLQALEKKLNQASGTIFVAIESIYSMDGDRAPLKEIAKLCKQYHAEIILDEAHATGVIGEKGEGLAQYLSLESEIFARVHTFGKAMGCHGAIVLGSETLRTYLVNFARSFIYTTALSEHCLHAIEEAYKNLQSGDELNKLHQNIAYFQSRLTDKLKARSIPSQSPIQCLLVPGNNAIKSMEKKLQEKGMDIRAIMHPTVEEGKERIRICIHSFNTVEEINSCVESLEELIK